MMQRHPEAEALARLVAAWQQEQGVPPRQQQSLAQTRDLLRRMAPLRWRNAPIEMASVEDVILPTRAGPRLARVYHPQNSTGQFTLVYIHGGGYVVGGVEEFDPECRRFAKALGCDVVSITYRLAPEHPWPAGINDGEDALAAIVGGAIPRLNGPIVLVGMSAGAGLAAAICRRSVLAGASPLRLLVLLSPWLDMTMTLPSAELYATGYQLERDMMLECCGYYIPSNVPATHPELSAARNPVPPGWPETILFAAACDPLADDAALFARRLAEAEVPHHLRFAAGMQHGCHGWWEHLPALKPDLDWFDAAVQGAVARVQLSTSAEH
jgi:acetyl esterase